MVYDTKRPDDSVAEETSAFGQRVKGAVKDGVGAITGNESLEREGERENAQGRARQGRNDVLEETDGVPGASVGSRSTSGWSSKHLVTGLYDNPAAAGKAYQDLTTRHGYKANDISVVMSDATRKRHFGDVKPGQEFKEGSKAAEGAGIGGGIGIGVGAALGALVAAATAIAIPGIGLVVRARSQEPSPAQVPAAPRARSWGRSLARGIPEDRAAEYERGLKEGGIVLGTRAKDHVHASELERDFMGHGARDVRR